nr:FkbM family methyltransferase [Polynucleobacter sp. 86C-FISCH]
MERLQKASNNKAKKPKKISNKRSSIPAWLSKEVDGYFATQVDVKPKTILDIGANIGAFALRAHQEWPEAKVICYEPMPFNIEALKANVDSAWCQVEPYAVRASAGSGDIYIGDMFVTGGFQKKDRQTDSKISVQCLAASSLPSAELIKIDTEGCELEILERLDLRQTQVIMLEHHSLDDAKKIKSLLAKNYVAIQDESDREVGTEVFVRKV